MYVVSPLSARRKMPIGVSCEPKWMCSFLKIVCSIRLSTTGAPAKSLIRMFGPRGNPQARNLFGVIGYLQQQASVELHVMPGPRGSARLAA